MANPTPNVTDAQKQEYQVLHSLTWIVDDLHEDAELFELMNRLQQRLHEAAEKQEKLDQNLVPAQVYKEAAQKTQDAVNALVPIRDLIRDTFPPHRAYYGCP